MPASSGSPPRPQLSAGAAVGGREVLVVAPSATDTFGQVVLEAQASGLPVVAVAAGGPLDLIDDGATGVLCRPEAHVLAAEICDLLERPDRRRALGDRAADAARARTWEASLERLAAAYRRVLPAGESSALASAA